MANDSTRSLILVRDNDGDLSVERADSSDKPQVLGYDPLQHLALGLGSCLLEFSDRFLSRRGYPRAAELEVTWTFDARRCRVSTLQGELRLAIDLDEGELAILERMLSQCPVHQALQTPLDVPTRVRLTNSVHPAVSLNAASADPASHRPVQAG